MNWKSLKIAAGSNDSTKAVGAEAQTQAIPNLRPQRPTLGWGHGARDKAGWTARSLNSLLSPSKSHTFPSISPSESIGGFNMWHISCRSLADTETQRGAEYSGWLQWTFTDICEQIQGHRVPEAQPTSFQFRLWVTAITLVMAPFLSASREQEQDWTLDRTV